MGPRVFVSFLHNPQIVTRDNILWNETEYNTKSIKHILIVFFSLLSFPNLPLFYTIIIICKVEA